MTVPTTMLMHKRLLRRADAVTDLRPTPARLAADPWAVPYFPNGPEIRTYPVPATWLSPSEDFVARMAARVASERSLEDPPSPRPTTCVRAAAITAADTTTCVPAAAITAADTTTCATAAAVTAGAAMPVVADSTAIAASNTTISISISTTVTPVTSTCIEPRTTAGGLASAASSAAASSAKAGTLSAATTTTTTTTTTATTAAATAPATDTAITELQLDSIFTQSELMQALGGSLDATYYDPEETYEMSITSATLPNNHGPVTTLPSPALPPPSLPPPPPPSSASTSSTASALPDPLDIGIDDDFTSASTLDNSNLAGDGVDTLASSIS